MTIQHMALAEVIRRDPRYAIEAYDFVFEALKHTQKMLGRLPAEMGEVEPGPQHHVSGRELLEGIRDLALREFGLMARTVFRLWGVKRTDDFGNIIFNLVDAKLMSKTDDDTRAEFHDVYDFDEALVKAYRIQLEEAE
jgi:uncharacterized repeat protein (TIGR04138 family)